jgi:hypothetical protein
METGKEQSGTNVVQSVGVLSVSSHTSDITKTTSVTVEQSQQHSTSASSGRQTFYISNNLDIYITCLEYISFLQL